MAQGHTNPEIATELGMTIDGAKWHVREILSKLGVNSREEAVAAWKAGQQKPPRALLITGAVAAASVAAIVVGVSLWIAFGRTMAPGSASTPAVSATAATATITSPAATASTTAVPATAGLPFTAGQMHNAGVASARPATAPGTKTLAGANALVVAGDAVLAATDNGISRSTDNGASWHSVLSGVQMWSVTAATDGSGYVALGHTPYASDSDTGHAILATSPDGVHWQSVEPQTTVASPEAPLGYGERIVFNGIGADAVGIAIPDIVASAQPEGRWRTTDGGRTWAPLSLKGADTGLQMMPDSHTVYVTAGGADSKTCAGEVYRSTDAGATWSGLPGSCETDGLYAVQFLNADVGFAGGGRPQKYGGDQVVERTTDGGTTWQTVWRTSPQQGDPSKPVSYDSEVVRLDMVDAAYGWATTGGCTGGENGPCDGAVYVTSDGGVHWSRTSQNAASLAVVDAEHVIVGAPHDASMALTSDRGKNWTVQSPTTAVTTSAFTGSGGWIAWTTSLGVFESKDGGKTWTSFDSPIIAAVHGGWWSVAAPGNVVGGVSGDTSVVASDDNGRTMSAVSLGPDNPATQVLASDIGPDGEAAAITGPLGSCSDTGSTNKIERIKPGWKPPTGTIELLISHDAGRTWTPDENLPFDVFGAQSLAITTKTMAIVDACGDVHVSGDEGTSWKVLQDSGKPAPFCNAAAIDMEIWLACSTFVAGGASQGWILHSSDAGKSWTTFQLPSSMNTSNGVVTNAGIVATGPQSAVMAVDAALWSTPDGGKTWSESWPSLPGEH